MKKNSIKQQVFEENFKKNFAAAKELSERSKEEKREEASKLAETLFVKHQSILCDIPLWSLNKKLSECKGESKIGVSTKIPVDEMDQLAFDILKCKIRNELAEKISNFIGDDAYEIEISYSIPACGWSKEIEFFYTFSF